MAAKNDYILYDEHLGNLKIHINQRSRHTIFRTKDDGVHITVPPFVEEKRIRELVGEFRLRLEAAMKEVKRPLIDLNFQLETDCVKLRLRQGEYDRFGVEYEQDRIWIVCPSAVQFADETLRPMAA